MSKVKKRPARSVFWWKWWRPLKTSRTVDIAILNQEIGGLAFSMNKPVRKKYRTQLEQWTMRQRRSTCRQVARPRTLLGVRAWDQLEDWCQEARGAGYNVSKVYSGEGLTEEGWWAAKNEQEAANLCREKVWVSRLTHFPGMITALVTILYETAVNIFSVWCLKFNFMID